jgi:hypothetical protein
MSGSVIEGLGGITGAVLAVLGLAGVLPGYMVSIAAITLGVALLFEGGAVASRYSRLLHVAGGDQESKLEIGGGSTVEFLGGASGIVLGILALLGIAGDALLPVAAIVFGATLMLSAGTTAKLDSFRVYGSGHPQLDRIASESIRVASGAQLLIGVAGVVLGILALTGTQPLTLTLVAFLAVGASLLLSGSAITAKMEDVEQPTV